MMILLVLFLLVLWIYAIIMWLESGYRVLKWGMSTSSTNADFDWEDAFGGE
jgi:hypothetical protein